MSDRALVLFSGGQDSTTCLAWALSRFELVETVGFDYGQRHRVELDCRGPILDALRRTFPHWAARLGEDRVVDLGLIGEISETALTRDVEIRMAENRLPNTFVPGRNILFFTVAAALAYRRGLKRLVGGMCETDFSGYPDCRDDTLKVDKPATWALARDLGRAPLVEIIRRETHSCYQGDRGQLHEWGYGCGTCPACELRRQGYAAFVAVA
jgi:7-cyano-7-deazaguanine synthase